MNMTDLEKFTLGGYAIKIKRNEDLVSEELTDFCALAYRYSNELSKDIDLYYNKRCFDNNKLLEDSRRLYYESKLYHNEQLFNYEEDDLSEINAKWFKYIRELIRRSIQKAGEQNIKKALIENESQIKVLAKECLNFNCGILQMRPKSIWWNKERMLHIYSGHVSETFLSYYRINYSLNNTLFLHGISEIHELIMRVLDTIDDEIQIYFKTNIDKPFCKKRIEYDNDFYSIRINNDGKLMMFHRV